MRQRRRLLLGSQTTTRHPLTRGLLGWWTGLPRAVMGQTWFDVTRGEPGTHQNAPSWSGNTRPGRLGSCPSYVAASSQWTALPDLDRDKSLGGMDGLATCTVAFWVYRTPGTHSNFGRGVTTATRFVITWHTTNQLFAAIGTPTNAINANAASGWNHLLATYDGNAGSVKFQIYLNGVQQTWQAGNNVSATTIPTATGTGLGRTIGITDLADIRYATGSYDDLAIWNRTLSADEARAWYVASMLGHPETLRRLSRRVIFQLAGASVGSLTAALDAIGLTGAAASVAPVAAAADLATILGNATLSGTGTATTPTPAAADLAASLDATTLTGAATAETPSAATGDLSATLDAATLAASGLAVEAGTVSGSLTVTLDAMTVAAAATCVVTTSVTMWAGARLLPDDEADRGERWTGARLLRPGEA